LVFVLSELVFLVALNPTTHDQLEIDSGPKRIFCDSHLADCPWPIGNCCDHQSSTKNQRSAVGNRQFIDLVAQTLGYYSPKLPTFQSPEI